jgi:hypothetical protein
MTTLTTPARLGMLYRMNDAVEGMALEEMRLNRTYYFTYTPAEEMLEDARLRKQAILARMTYADAIEANAAIEYGGDSDEAHSQGND